MGLVLDSSILIASERRKFNLTSFIESEVPTVPLFISVLTASELLHGVHRAVPQYRLKREAFVESILSKTPILAFDVASARIHAKLWAELEMRGQRIGAHDMLIAATCLAFGHQLATLNEGEFERVDGLKLANARPYASAK